MLPRNDANQGEDWIRNKNRSYTNRETGETISRRQYDKRFGVLAEQGFNSYEARTKAEKYTVDGPFPKSKTIHHVYNLGLPNDIARVIEHTIEKSPHFGTKMFLSLEVEVYGDGRPYKKWVGSRVVKKAGFMIKTMLDDLEKDLEDYEIEYVNLQYELTVIDRSTLE